MRELRFFRLRIVVTPSRWTTYDCKKNKNKSCDSAEIVDNTVTMKTENDIKAGDELILDGGLWVYVDDVEDGVIYCTDQDGADYTFRDGEVCVAHHEKKS